MVITGASPGSRWEQVQTPNEGMNTELNIWNLYQSEINVLFSRFTSFIEVGGRTGLGFRDTAQDAMTIPHAEPVKCRSRLMELLRAVVSEGYGLHLFEPRWFEPEPDFKPFKSPTVIPTPKQSEYVHGIKDACADDALWLVSAVVQYIRETGEIGLAYETVTYADGGQDSVYEHLKRILDFSAREIGQNGICKGLPEPWRRRKRHGQLPAHLGDETVCGACLILTVWLLIPAYRLSGKSFQLYGNGAEGFIIYISATRMGWRKAFVPSAWMGKSWMFCR